MSNPIYPMSAEKIVYCRVFREMYMKLRLMLATLGLAVLAASGLQAQLFVGPNLQVGMTHSKNFVIEDTSRYYIANGPGIFAAGGVDFAYQFDDKIRVQLGGQGQLRTFNVKAPDGVTGLSFTNIKKNAVVVSVPLSINYRIPLSKGGNKYFNIMAGHSLDFSFHDSVVTKSPMTSIDSGGAFLHHFYETPRQKFPITSVLLGVGADMKSAKGNVFNVSLVWSLSTRTLWRGSVQEWEVLHQNYDPSTATADPEEFPDHYYEWALRGSHLSLRASYLFELTGNKEGKEKKDKDDEDEDDKETKPSSSDESKSSKPSKAKRDKDADEEEGGKPAQPAKEKAAKPVKEKAAKPEKEKAEKPSKEKPSKPEKEKKEKKDKDAVDGE